MTIQDIINKYEKNYVDGERHSSETNTRIQQEIRRKEKHDICEQLLFESKPLMLSEYEKKRVHFLIDKFKNFKSLHHTASKEAVILSFIFFIKMTTQPNLDITRWSITKKYNLSRNTFETIICRIAEAYIKECPIPITKTEEYNHEILSKHGGKI